ncbi:MAG TPA: TlpA disulfide reductase family protein, partial [Candidatus Tectomicrobia bacterium]|nr:TlpA disulfide reductase family protein [Candidatus Tectomicrobia bacterium]
MMLKKCLILVALLPVLALFAYGLTRDPSSFYSPLVGRQAGDFTLQLFDGGKFTLSEQRGKVVVMNVWSSWCIPACYNEAPALEAAWQRYRSQDVVFVGVNYQDRDGAAREFLARFRHTFPNGPDAGSKVAIEYGLRGVPETFFIDRDGRIVHKHVGEISLPMLVHRIEELLHGSGGTS